MNQSTQTQAIQVFNFKTNAVRTLLQDNEPWFVATDVCTVLEISNNRHAVSRLDEDERRVAISDTFTGEKEVTIINESGLYSLILTSRKPQAKAFKKWITSEVLPAIRKTGQYIDPSAMNALLANEPLTPAQTHQIRQAINKRLKPNFKAAGGAYLYQKLRNEFQVKFYTEIRRGDFTAALALVQTSNPAELLVEADGLKVANP
jgi:prophage antirepressor-like protein